MAYRIYAANCRRQLKVAMGTVGVGMFYVWLAVPPEQQATGVILVLGIGPRMLGFLPAQINSAANELNRNIPSTVASACVSLAIIFGSVHFHWGILGLAISHPISQTVDLLTKLFMTRRRREMWRMATSGVEIDPTLAVRMSTFASQGLGLLLLNLLVWDRSDLFFLRWLNSDLRQVTHFSYSFTLVDKLLILPQVVGNGLGLNLLSYQGHNHQLLAKMAISSTTYLLLIGAPVLLGAAALARQVWMIYGDQFAPAVPVFLIMAVLAIPRSILYATNVFLQAADQQRFTLLWGCVCGIANVLIDLWLIPTHGAVGAAIGNGTGQTLAAVGAWIYIVRRYSPVASTGRLLRILLSGFVMASVANIITLLLPTKAGALSATVAGIGVYLLMLRVTSTLGEDDRNRLLSLTGSMPAPLRQLLVRRRIGLLGYSGVTPRPPVPISRDSPMISEHIQASYYTPLVTGSDAAAVVRSEPWHIALF